MKRLNPLNDWYYNINHLKDYLNKSDVYLTSWDMYKFYMGKDEDNIFLSYLDQLYVEFKDNISHTPIRFKKKR